MTNSSDLGPLILAGSGEYTPTMEVVDRYLLAACDGRPVLLIATACAQEGDERMTWGGELGGGWGGRRQRRPGRAQRGRAQPLAGCAAGPDGAWAGGARARHGPL